MRSSSNEEEREKNSSGTVEKRKEGKNLRGEKMEEIEVNVIEMKE